MRVGAIDHPNLCLFRLAITLDDEWHGSTPKRSAWLITLHYTPTPCPFHRQLCCTRPDGEHKATLEIMLSATLPTLQVVVIQVTA